MVAEESARREYAVAWAVLAIFLMPRGVHGRPLPLARPDVRVRLDGLGYRALPQKMLFDRVFRYRR